MRGIKILAGDKKAIVVVERILSPVGVDLTIVGVEIDIRKIQIAIIVAPNIICKISSVPLLFEYSQS